MLRAPSGRVARASPRAADVLMFLLCRGATVDSTMAMLPALRASFQGETRARIMRTRNRLRPPAGSQVDPVRASIAVADMETALVVDAQDLWHAPRARVGIAIGGGECDGEGVARPGGAG